VRIAVVIPALDEADHVGQAIASAALPGVEVVVVDGGSTDDTVARASAAGARVVAAPRGRAAQLEAGSRACGGDVVLFLHADTRLPDGWRDAILRVLEDPGTVGGAFRFRFAREQASRLARVGLRAIEWGVAVRMGLARLPYGDQALFVRRTALEAIGGVPHVPIMEDLDLVRALRARGRVALLPLAVVTSPRRYLARGLLRTMLRNWAAATAWALHLDRARVAAWYRR
jgi:rSAM/selenodomain-associated transferase 2